MKFTEKQAYEALVAKMTIKGETLQVSERTINKLLNTFYKKFVDEETELDDFVSNYVEDFKELDGNMRKEKSDFVKDYQAKNPQQKKEENNTTTTVDKTETQQLLERLEKLEKEKAEADKAKVISSKKNELVTAIKAKGVKDENWINGILAKVAISEGIDIEAEANDYLNIYNKQQAYFNPNMSPDASGSATTVVDDYSDVIDAVKRGKGKI